jgi:uncharacterized phage-associated protein
VSKALEVANFFILKAPLTHLKVQKLVYLSHGWYLGLTGKPLLEELVARWEYGPCVETLWNYYGCASYPLPLAYEGEAYYVLADDCQRKLCEKIWAEYGVLTDLELSSICHMEGSPWERARGPFIDNLLIMEYYKGKVNANVNEQ